MYHIATPCSISNIATLYIDTYWCNMTLSGVAKSAGTLALVFFRFGGSSWPLPHLLAEGQGLCVDRVSELTVDSVCWLGNRLTQVINISQDGHGESGARQYGNRAAETIHNVQLELTVGSKELFACRNCTRMLAFQDKRHAPIFVKVNSHFLTPLESAGCNPQPAIGRRLHSWWCTTSWSQCRASRWHLPKKQSVLPGKHWSYFWAPNFVFYSKVRALCAFEPPTSFRTASENSTSWAKFLLRACGRSKLAPKSTWDVGWWHGSWK